MHFRNLSLIPIFRQYIDNKIDAYTKMQSNLLKRVNLKISGIPNPNMLSTSVDFKRGEYQDPCAGDGGGPLMKRAGGRWVLLGKFRYTHSVWNQIFCP